MKTRRGFYFKEPIRAEGACRKRLAHGLSQASAYACRLTSSISPLLSRKASFIHPYFLLRGNLGLSSCSWLDIGSTSNFPSKNRFFLIPTLRRSHRVGEPVLISGKGNPTSQHLAFLTSRTAWVYSRFEVALLKPTWHVRICAFPVFDSVSIGVHASVRLSPNHGGYTYPHPRFLELGFGSFLPLFYSLSSSLFPGNSYQLCDTSGSLAFPSIIWK